MNVINIITINTLYRLYDFNNVKIHVYVLEKSLEGGNSIPLYWYFLFSKLFCFLSFQQ